LDIGLEFLLTLCLLGRICLLLNVALHQIFTLNQSFDFLISFNIGLKNTLNLSVQLHFFLRHGKTLRLGLELLLLNKISLDLLHQFRLHFLVQHDLGGLCCVKLGGDLLIEVVINAFLRGDRESITSGQNTINCQCFHLFLIKLTI
jgi:hypothetical protein